MPSSNESQLSKDVARYAKRKSDIWGLVGSMIVLAALPWIISAGFSYFMWAWRAIP